MKAYELCIATLVTLATLIHGLNQPMLSCTSKHLKSGPE